MDKVLIFLLGLCSGSSETEGGCYVTPLTETTFIVTSEREKYCVNLSENTVKKYEQVSMTNGEKKEHRRKFVWSDWCKEQDNE